MNKKFERIKILPKLKRLQVLKCKKIIKMHFTHSVNLNKIVGKI